MLVHLATQEAVLRSQVALYAGEAEHPLRLEMCQQQAGEPPHGVPHQVKACKSPAVYHLHGRLHQQRQIDLRRVIYRSSAATGRIPGQERAIVKLGMMDEVGVILLGGTKAVQEDDGSTQTSAADGGQVQAGLAQLQRLTPFVKAGGHGISLMLAALKWPGSRLWPDKKGP
ncbi:hypothetical protein D3C72_1607870 [compost metagenome]